MEVLNRLQPLPIDAVLPQLLAALRVSSSVVLRAPTGAGKTTRVPPALLDELVASSTSTSQTERHPPQRTSRRSSVASGQSPVASAIPLRNSEMRRVIVLEPRRVAARAAARRMTFERDGTLGEEVGYQVRFDRKWNNRTRILVVTEGTLVRMLQDDPFLEDVAVVVFDEFHERSLDTDLSLGMVRRVQQTVRPDLKLVVMSATLGVEAVSAYLGNAPIVASEGRLFPVEISYEPRGENVPLSVAVARAVERVLHNFDVTKSFHRKPEACATGNAPTVAHASGLRLNDFDGDILIFLPGQREIREAARELESLARDHDILLMPLFGELSPEQQDAALQRQAKRKIVLATNVAETSVTVDGVTVVIDTGLSRQLRFDPNVGLDRLELLPISRASAEQRAGRAGRQQPGLCIRLWNEASHRARPEHTPPEIQRVDLAGSVLQLKAWGESDVLAFPWFEPPRAESIAQAESVLRRLGAIDSKGHATELGLTLAKLPVHPRLGRLLMEGARLGQPERAALAAALLSERDPFESHTSRVRHKSASESDVLDRVEALEEFERTGRETTSFGNVSRGAAQFVVQTKQQLLKSIDRRIGSTEMFNRNAIGVRVSGVENPNAHADGVEVKHESALLRALLAAFPDRLAKRREANSPRGVMVGGRGVKLGPQSGVTQAELFLCLDVEGSGSEALVRSASTVERSWLPDEMLTIGTEVFFDEPSGRVQARRRVCWDDLILEESPAQLPDDDSVSRMLAEAATTHWEGVRPKDDSPAARFLARVRSLREWLPELNLSAFDDAELQSLLPSLCLGRRSLADLRNAPWLETIQSALTSAQWQSVEREAPTHLTVPSGSRIALEYEPGRSPILAVRIQEIFGLRETPRVARGRVPVLLHLLAPNYRPQQVTDDLPSFWANAYPIIRGELRRRYPRHPWPDNPLAAVAVKK
ncbi:MAG: ATP-dependent RNA helicase [Planctomycetaceae bacterium]